MKIKRLKSYRKRLDTYSKYFGLNLDPLEVFVDSTFVRYALLNKLNIEHQFKCTLDCPVVFVTSSCVILECKALGSLFGGVLKVLETFKVLKCTHKMGFKDIATKCIQRRLRTVSKKLPELQKKMKKNVLFAVATNDKTLHKPCLSVSGTPLFYIAHKRINMSVAEDVFRQVNEQANNAGFVSQYEVS